MLKTQKGKCIHCGLYFTPTDIVEVDHIQPRSLGGKDEYKNLQLLHKHCHGTKTENDGSLNRKYYSNPFWICILKKDEDIKERNEAKVSRSVLNER